MDPFERWNFLNDLQYDIMAHAITIRKKYQHLSPTIYILSSKSTIFCGRSSIRHDRGIYI